MTKEEEAIAKAKEFVNKVPTDYAARNVGGIPPCKGMKLTFVLPDEPLKRSYQGVTYYAFPTTDGEVSYTQVCRRGNGLNLEGTFEEMIEAFYARIYLSGGRYDVKVDEIFTRPSSLGGTSNYLHFQPLTEIGVEQSTEQTVGEEKGKRNNAKKEGK